jgi:phage terminase large subunit
MSSPQAKRKIDFSVNQDELFTQVFWKIQEATKRYVIVYGGAASSKSYSVHQSELIKIMQKGEGDTLFIRKNAADIRESCFKLLQTLISNYGVGNYFRQLFGNDQRKIIYSPTGRAILFKGIDDSEKLKSIVGIKRIIIEEANQLDFEDFLELDRRARGYEDIQIIFILNPISENHWIKKNFCEPGAAYFENSEVLKFTYHDNVNGKGESMLRQADIDALERLKAVSENHYKIYALGEWGIDNKEGKFCWAFHSGQVVPTVHDPERITWATFDFNLNPMTCTIVQIIPEEETIRAIECIKLENSDIWKMCDRLLASYPDVAWMVTGDATGKSGSAMVQDAMNYYKIIIQKLQITEQQVKIPAKNPPIEENQLLVNAVHKNWKVEIDPDRCQPLIYDLQYVEMNGRGEIVKDRTSASKYADFLDGWRYIVNIAVKPHFDMFK